MYLHNCTPCNKVTLIYVIIFQVIDSQYHSDFSISSITSCLMYLLCINNKDDDDDGLGISSSCRKIPKIGYLLYADWLRYIYSIINYQEPGLALTHFRKTH